jgi:ribosomal protein L37AE/L43A
MESINSIIISRIKNLIETIRLLDLVDPPKVIEDITDGISFIELDSKSNAVSEAEGILEKYLISVTGAFAENNSEDFNMAVIGSGILIKLEDLELGVRSRYNKLAPKVMSKKNPKKDHAKAIIEAFNILDSLDRCQKITHKKLKSKKEDGQICEDCKVSMILAINVGEYNCPQCKTKKTAYGIVPFDTYLENVASGKPSGNYKREENCEIWLSKIQGLETKVIPDDLLEKLREKAREAGLLQTCKISCKNIRQWLKEPDIDDTQYNNHIPKIRFLLTGIAPERLTDKETQEARNYFKPIMDEYNIVKSPNRKNSLYQPYVLLKILEEIVDRSTQELERRFLRIVSNIHFQDSGTIRADDEVMMRIKVGLDFKPTDIDYYRDLIAD